MRPLIAVTGVPIVAGGVLGWRQSAVACTAAYVDAVSRAGGDPVILPPVLLDDETASARLSRFDGLMLTGGGDIDPPPYRHEDPPQPDHVPPPSTGRGPPPRWTASPRPGTSSRSRWSGRPSSGGCRRCASAAASRSSTWPSAERCTSTSAPGRSSSPTATRTEPTASSTRSGP